MWAVQQQADPLWTTTPTLEGPRLRLEPLSDRHCDGLAHAIDADTFKYFPPPFGPHLTARQGAELCLSVRAKDTLALALVLRSSGRCVGSSCFGGRYPEHRSIEIGGTFIAREHRGTFVNPEAKLLMLTHAFETLACVRVQLKCDARNLQSQNAIARLGAIREGVLRNHMIMSDGFVRDTVMFSITNEEWPRVKQGLLARLARFGDG